jgi:hypothetical protein
MSQTRKDEPMIRSPAWRNAVTITAGLAFGALSTGLPAPLTADTQAASASERAVVTLMSVIGFDASVAAEHGYELRTAPDGNAASVPVGNAAGDFTGALGGSVGLDHNTVPGDCGNSWIYFQNGDTEIRTGYLIKSDHGQAFSHRWSATVATEGMGGSIGTYDMTGIAPLNSASWQGIRKIVQPYTSKASAVAGGTAVTTGGFICGAGEPTAKYPE